MLFEEFMAETLGPYDAILGGKIKYKGNKLVEPIDDIGEIDVNVKEFYRPYLQSRQFEDYEETSGFGLGWERLLQGLLEMPFIYSISHFPRVDKTLKP